jgi:ribonuclease VapC
VSGKVKPRFVLDASAVIALLRRERGFRVVAAAVPRAAMSAVNVAEVLTKAIEVGSTVEDELRDLAEWRLTLAPFTPEDATLAALFVSGTRAHGLSLGDRACLALASRLRVPALTADKAWAALNVGVEVRLIR